MAKRIIYNENARRALEKGIDILCEAVAVTLGPKGRNVVLEKKFGAPQIINDGVTIAKEIELEDHIENTGVALIRQAASKTNDAAGDGTTTATVLAHAMVKAGLRNVAAGANAITLTRGGEDHLLGASLNVHAGLLIGVEHTGGLEDQIHTPVLPRTVQRVPVGEELDFFPIDDHGIVGGFDLYAGIEFAQNRVVGQQMSAGLGVGRGVHANDFDTGISAATDPTPHHIATDSAESIDRNAQSHMRSGQSAGNGR